MEKKKIKLGQFFTRASIWLKPQIEEFIAKSGCQIAYDPYAGGGDLLKAAKEILLFKKVKGLDIDGSLNWDVNDSLKNIPHVDDAIIITNPPYLSNYSASRKKIYDSVAAYFNSSKYDDLYLIALERMLEAQDFVVAIIPETFINSSFKGKERLNSITVLEDNPFEDTDTPVCVVCFDKNAKDFSNIKVYKNDEYIFSLSKMESLRLEPQNSVKIKFNVLSAWLGLRAVDTTNPKEMIKFDFKENFDYNWDKGIKVSSRLLSIIDIKIPEKDKKQFITECNSILLNIREASKDIILSPFKGNMKNGVRRRRLDFYTARAILEKAYSNLYAGGEKNVEQLRLF